MNLGPVPNWTLREYCGECAGLIQVKHSDTMAAEVKSLVMYDPIVIALSVIQTVVREKGTGRCQVDAVQELSRTIAWRTCSLFGVRKGCPTVAGSKTLPMQIWRWPVEIRGYKVGFSVSHTRTFTSNMMGRVRQEI